MSSLAIMSNRMICLKLVSNYIKFQTTFAGVFLSSHISSSSGWQILSYCINLFLYISQFIIYFQVHQAKLKCGKSKVHSRTRKHNVAEICWCSKATNTWKIDRVRNTRSGDARDMWNTVAEQLLWRQKTQRMLQFELLGQRIHMHQKCHRTHATMKSNRSNNNSN